MYRNLVKPFIDRISALILLIISGPIFLIAIALLLLFNKGHVWFIQERPGKNGQLFRLFKFKTMKDVQDHNDQPLPDEERLTWVGEIIRKLSIDELPQLFNVLKGDMSLVGPRPLLVEYLPLYSVEQKKRHDVKPGITGWAQVNGRNTISWNQKFAYDVWYVEHQTFWLDIKILFLTALKVLKAEGISSEGSVTMERFRGN